MAALGDSRGGDVKRTLGMAGGVGALLAGLLALTAGGANVLTSILVETGVPSTPARQIAVATVSTLPPVVLGGLLVMTKPKGRGRLVGLAGVAVALTGVAVGLPLGFESALPIVAAVYGTGVFFVLAALVHGMATDEQPGRTDTRPGWQRTGSSTLYRSSGNQPMPADGGDEDDDLTFLLGGEDDEE